MSNTFSRRHFLQYGMAAIAGGTALGGLPVHAAQAPAGTAAPQNDLVKGYCPFCQVRCTYHARVRNGKILELIGDRGNRWTGGAMCPKGLSIVELLNSPYRLVQPMLKQGSEWKTISYAEAVDIVVDKLRQSRAKHGDKIAERLALTSPLWDCRESELAALMTMRTAGGVNVMPAGEVCISTASNVLGMLLGANTSTTTVNEIVNAKTLVLWGANISETYPPYTRWLDKARDAGVRIVSVDCRKTPTSAWAADQLMPLPGTVGAIRFVLENGAFDRARVGESITGFELMEKGAQPWSVDKVAQATGLSEDAVTAFYRTLAESPRTIIWMGGCLSRYTNGLQSIRAIIALQALRDNLKGEPMLLVRLVDREQGLIVAPGNPLGIHGIADLAREDVRFINRQRGSGTRVLLDYRLKQLGIRPQQLAGYEDEEYTHMNVAAAVLSGRAHTGLAVRAAACALGLDFVPVGVEEYDLVIPQRYAGDERILALLDVIRSGAFRKEVAALGGYGVEKTGQVIWEYDGR